MIFCPVHISVMSLCNAINFTAHGFYKVLGNLEVAECTLFYQNLLHRLIVLSELLKQFFLFVYAYKSFFAVSLVWVGFFFFVCF